MVHAIQQSIQVYQDFHRQTLNYLQSLEQDSYKLMPQFELDPIYAMVERIHQIKAGARYLQLAGFEQFVHHMKGHYFALSTLTLTLDRDLLKLLIQMQELFRLCLLSSVATWQEDLSNVVSKAPVLFQALDQRLPIPVPFQNFKVSKLALETDMQRMLVATILCPELARLDMMVNNTPGSKLGEILILQLPRIQGLVQQLKLESPDCSMQETVFKIQARPKESRNLGTHALCHWSDLCIQCLSTPVLDSSSTRDTSQRSLSLPLKNASEDKEETLFAEFEQSCLNIDSTPVPLGVQAIVRVLDLLQRCAADANRDDAEAFAQKILSTLKLVDHQHSRPDPHWKFVLLQCFNHLKSLWLPNQDGSFPYPSEAEISKVLVQLRQLVSVVNEGSESLVRESVNSEKETLATLFTDKVEEQLTVLSVSVIEPDDEQLEQDLSEQIDEFLRVAALFHLNALRELTERVQNAIAQHPEQRILISRLAIQDWLWHQLLIVSGRQAERHPGSETLLELSQPELLQSSLPTDPALLNHLTQMELPDGFDPSEIASLSVDSEEIATLEALTDDAPMLQLSWPQLLEIDQSLAVCQADIEALSTVSPELCQSFERLREQFYQLRTTRLDQLVLQFEPMVDALGLQLGKKPQLKILGGDLAIDQKIANQLYQPLFHLISNAVIHGIEPIKARVRTGKPAEGSIFISGYRKDDTLLLEIRDDGKGLNFEVLRQLVIERKGLTPRQGKFLTESELLEYLFSSGFSTHRLTDAFSEHGVGLDIVQRALLKMNVSIDISTLINQGTTFRLKIPSAIVDLPELSPRRLSSGLSEGLSTPVNFSAPLSVPIREILAQLSPGPSLLLPTKQLFIWADQSYVFVLACEHIEEYVMPHVTEAHRTQQTLLWREQTLAIYTLQDFLGFENGPDDSVSPDQDDVILIVKFRGQVMALRSTMSRLVNQQTIEINPLSLSTAAPRYILGGTSLQENPSIVIDVAALIQQQQVNLSIPFHTAQVLEPEFSLPQDSLVRDVSEDVNASNVCQIMVVDDSRTAREIVSMTLRQGGYTVVQAKDGQDALEQLRSPSLTVDLIISDVAMPRMNGLEFLRQCRLDESLRDLPIAMLSNCDSSTHSELAKKAGANAYLTKPYEEGAFLAEIATLLDQQAMAEKS